MGILPPRECGYPRESTGVTPRITVIQRANAQSRMNATDAITKSVKLRFNTPVQLFIAIKRCTIRSARRHQPIEHLRQVALQPRFKFDHANRRRAADREHMHDAHPRFRRIDDVLHLGGDVVHITVARGLQRQGLLMGHEINPV